MNALEYLAIGFSIALTPEKLAFCFVGVLLGTLIGVLPGLGPTAGIAVLIPLSAGLDSTTAIIMLAGIYYGAMYGGSTTSILINTPGETGSVVTCLDGYAMARHGRAGPALGMAAIASFIAGTVGIVLLMLLAPPLASFALGFSPADYFALMFLALTVVVSLAGRSLIKGLMSAVFGLMLATVGLDPITGQARFSYGNSSLLGGLEFVAVVVGLFGIAEVLTNLEREALQVYETRLKGIWPTLPDWRRSTGALIRGSLIGFVVGVLPGAGSAVASFLAYDIEKKSSKRPEEFGTGVIEGVAAPEGANNSASAGAMVPLLTLGIPGSGSTAVLLGALMIHGLRPGPLMFQENPEFAWALIASMYVGNIMLLVLNLPLIPLWARLVKVPYPILVPIVLTICFLGTYPINNSLFDVWIAIGFGVLGYLMRKLEFPPAPLILALILGLKVEANLGRSLVISKGSLMVFFTQPVALALILLAFASVALSLYMRARVPDAGAMIEKVSDA